MSLLTQSDQRRGTAVSNDLLRLKVEQALVNAAIAILAESPSTPARQAWAEAALDASQAAMVRLMPYVVQNATIQTSGGEATDNDVIFVLSDPATGVLNTLYPLA